MRDPILQDRRQEHVTFQKYALELLELVSGKSKPNGGNELEPSLTNIHRVCVYSIIIYNYKLYKSSSLNIPNYNKNEGISGQENKKQLLST
jgi:hypothetical protein